MQNHSGLMFLLVVVVLMAAGYALMTRDDVDLGGSLSIDAIRQDESLVGQLGDTQSPFGAGGPTSAQVSAETKYGSQADAANSLSSPEETSAAEETPQLGELVLVKFGATWCPPCRAIDQQLSQLKVTHKGIVDVIQVDVDDHPELARQYNVSSIPRLILFQDGKKVADEIGYLSHEQLAQWVGMHQSETAVGEVKRNPYASR